MNINWGNSQLTTEFTEYTGYTEKFSVNPVVKPWSHCNQLPIPKGVPHSQLQVVVVQDGPSGAALPNTPPKRDAQRA